jgi:ornithine carbamoyltransferase
MTAVEASTSRHLLRVADLDRAELDALLDLAATMKRHPLAWRAGLEGRSVACYHAGPSTRSRVSFEVAINRLGAVAIMLRAEELQLERGESIRDTARVLSAYCDAIVARVVPQRDLHELAAHASVPVINALTNTHDPCQGLADCLTLRERFGGLAGLPVAYIGPGGSAAHSLIEAAAASDMELRVASPCGHQADPAILAAAGRAVRIVDDPGDAVSDARAVYVGPWSEAPPPDYRVTAATLRRAHPDAVFLHPLPARRGVGVDPDVIDGPSTLVWDQVANRLPAEQALLYALVTGDWEV